MPLPQPTSHEAPSRAPWMVIGICLWGIALLWLYLSQRTAPPTIEAAGRGLAGLLTLGLFAVGLSACGRGILAALLREEARAIGALERYLFSFALGSAALSLVIFLAGWLGVWYPSFFLTLAALMVVPACFTRFSEAMDEARQSISIQTLFLVAPFLSLAAAAALAEPASTDALLYHLSVPETYLRQHSLQPIPNNFFSFWPMATEMLYALGLSISGETTPALMNLLFGLATLLWLEAKKSGPVMVGPAALFLSMPAVTINAGFPYADLPETFFVVSAYFAYERLRSRGLARWAVVCGGLCSAAVATKYTGFYAVIGLGCLLLSSRTTRRGGVLLGFLLALLVFAGPVLARNSFLTGNPVYPFFGSVIGAPAGDTYRAERQAHELSYIEGDLNQGWTQLLMLPHYYLFKQPFLDYAIGPLAGVLLPLLLLVLSRQKRLLAFVMLFCGFWLALSPQTRHLFPALSLLCLALAEGLRELAERYRGAATCLFLLIALIALVNYLHLVFFYRVTFDPIPRVIGSETREQYLGRVCQDWPAVDYLNRHLGEGEAVLTVGQMSCFYLRGQVFPESKYDTPLAVTLLRGCASPGDYARRLSRRGFAYLLYNGHEIQRMSWIPGEYLDFANESEKRIFHEFIATCCDRVFRSDGVSVYRLRPDGA